MGKKKQRTVWLLLTALCFLVFCLSGCSSQKENTAETKAYTVYYTNLTGTRLEGRSYTPQADRFDGILSELLKQFETAPVPEVASAMPSGVSINGYTMGVADLQVDFNAAYLSITNVQEVLLRAGLVKTLVQLPGVTKVMFTVDGQPLTDSDGREVQAMDEDTFIDSQGNGINSYHYTTLELYFSNAAGDKVVKEMRNVFYSSNLITEKIIVEQIIRGPVNARLLPVADPSVAVRSVKISKDICIVDLDEKFNTIPANNAAQPETCLYAFVNAICDACEVKGVRFKINGESDVRFRGQVNLDQVFERNAEVIEASGVSEPLMEIFLDEEGSETERGDMALAEKETGEAVQAGASAMQEETELSGTKKETEGVTEASGEKSKETGAGNYGGGNGVGVDPALVDN